MKSKYLELDEFSNAFDYLQKTKLFLDSQEDEYWAKWVCLTLSDALYHFMLCRLGQSSYHNIIDFKNLKKKEKIVLNSLPEIYDEEKYEEAEKIKDKYIHGGKGKIFRFDVCLDRISSLQPLGNEGKITLMDCDIINAKELRSRYRNNFQHYLNTNWRFEHEIFKIYFKSTMVIIGKIYESNSLSGYCHNKHYEELKVLIDDVKDKIEEI